MAFTLDKIFTTITSAPASRTGITEVPPCDALKPYVRCFWETQPDPDGREVRVIPDCCCDIIFSVDGNRISGNFCGVSNTSFAARDQAKTFGIRFYAWSVAPFVSESIDGLLNVYAPVCDVFDGFDNLIDDIACSVSMRERIDIAQRFLLKRLALYKQNHDVMNSLYLAISKRCRVNVSDLSEYCAVSKRSLEREFRCFTGTSPKQMIDLIRYQLLWQDAVKPNFNVLDSVEKFGFYDSAHLYHDFQKYHGISLPQAVKMF